MTVPDSLIRAWLDSPDVARVPHDDDGLTVGQKQRARMRPTSVLATAAAVTLQGFGYLTPVGDGSFLVLWRSAP